MQNVFQEVRISEQLDDAALYQFATVVNQYPRPNSDDYAEIFDELLDLLVHRSGKTGAEIITPRVIAKLLPLLLNIQEGTVYDGSFGTGRLLAYAYRYAKENGCKIKLVGQEINARAKWVFPVQIKASSVMELGVITAL